MQLKPVMILPDSSIKSKRSNEYKEFSQISDSDEDCSDGNEYLLHKDINMPSTSGLGNESTGVPMRHFQHHIEFTSFYPFSLKYDRFFQN